MSYGIFDEEVECSSNKCQACNGTGAVDVEDMDPHNPTDAKETCQMCNGSGVES